MPTPTLFSLAVYAVRVRNVREREFEIVSFFLDDNGDNDKDKDLLDVLSNQFKKYEQESADDENAQLILRVSKVFEEKRCIYGLIETGLYGRESILFNRKKKQDVYKKSRDEADMSPFFFLVDVPVGTDEAILILQRTGAHGIRKMLYSLLAPPFQEQFEDLRLRIDPLVLESDLEALFKDGRVTQIRYSKFGLSSDIADHYEGGHKESPGRMELIFHARRGDHFNLTAKIQQVLKGKAVKQIFALEEMDFDFDNVKLTMDENGRRRQVDLTRFLRARSYHNVTDKISIQGSGQPEFDSIKKTAFDLLIHTRKQIYGAGAP
jgi:hypothetical protein